MDTLDSDDALPVWLAPLADESLFGCGLRHDEANGFVSGTTMKAVARYSTGPTSLGNPALQFLGTAFDLRLFGLLINADEAAVEALTYRREIRSLFGPQATAHSMGELAGGFAVCRRCIAEQRFVGRLTSLPGVGTCLEHGILLSAQCGGCGRPLRPFAPSQRPFACRCGFDWSDGPVEQPTPQVMLIQRRVVAAYTFLLTELPADLVQAAERVARHAAQGRWRAGSEDVVHHPVDLLLRSWYESLAAIVALLVDRDLPPRVLVDVMRSEAPRGTGCHNQDCGAGPGEIARNGWRKNHPETYCRECDSRFLGRLIIESYDYGHGDHRLSERSVRYARARLLRRQVAVADAARRLRAQRPSGTITIGEVFAEAGIPTARNLRARRLRLVSIARAVLAGRAAETGGPSDPDPTRWRDHLTPPRAGTPPRALDASAKVPRGTKPDCHQARGDEASESRQGTFAYSVDFESFMARYPDEAACVRELAARKWPRGFRCPACGGSRSTILRQGRIWHCSDCDLQTALTAGTLMFGRAIPIRTWFAAAHLLLLRPELSATWIAHQLRISMGSATAIVDRVASATSLEALVSTPVESVR